ncbi:9503_t:CDS:2, partial [Funneliformis mosseae]
GSDKKCCDDGDHCCGLNDKCLPGGCLPPGADDCGNGYHCDKGDKCTSGGGCIPLVIDVIPSFLHIGIRKNVQMAATVI